MSFDWSEYLTLAQQLAGLDVTPPGQEATYRCALSRAYYAIFCLARNRLLDEGRTLYGDGRDHRHVQNEFKESPDPKRQTVGQYLNRLHTARIKADYRDSFPRLSRRIKIDMPLAQQALLILAKL